MSLPNLARLALKPRVHTGVNTKPNEAPGDEDECPMCYGTMTDPADPAVQTCKREDGSHWAHKSCAERWFSVNPTCQDCRKPVRDAAPPPPLPPPQSQAGAPPGVQLLLFGMRSWNQIPGDPTDYLLTISLNVRDPTMCGVLLNNFASLGDQMQVTDEYGQSILQNYLIVEEVQSNWVDARDRGEDTNGMMEAFRLFMGFMLRETRFGRDLHQGSHENMHLTTRAQVIPDESRQGWHMTFDFGVSRFDDMPVMGQDMVDNGTGSRYFDMILAFARQFLQERVPNLTLGPANHEPLEVRQSAESFFSSSSFRPVFTN